MDRTGRKAQGDWAPEPNNFRRGWAAATDFHPPGMSSLQQAHSLEEVERQLSLEELAIEPVAMQRTRRIAGGLSLACRAAGGSPPGDDCGSAVTRSRVASASGVICTSAGRDRGVGCPHPGASV